MAELSLRDRLQPALLDRLTDDERLVTVYRVTLDPARLAEHGVNEQDVERELGMQGLRRVGASAATDGASVHVYDEADYAKGDIKLFLTPDGKAGFAIKADGVLRGP